MSRPNAGWIFYKQVFEVPDNHNPEEWFTSDSSGIKKAQEKHLKEIHKDLAMIKLRDEYETLKNPCANEFIEDLETLYPGLLAGAGYSHETGLYGEFKLGFSFDHTTGLPVIPGSSVKGALRSVFPNATDTGKKERMEFLKWILEKTNNQIENEGEGEKIKNTDKLDIKKLEENIFDSKASIYNRDIFYDAHIIKPGKDRKILDNDFITPHKNKDGKSELDPFSNPTPLQFLKVLPGVTFRFQFKLHPFIKDDETIMSATQKRLLFRQILLTIGIGAKTNVGYGQFMTEDE